MRPNVTFFLFVTVILVLTIVPNLRWLAIGSIKYRQKDENQLKIRIGLRNLPK